MLVMQCPTSVCDDHHSPPEIFCDGNIKFSVYITNIEVTKIWARLFGIDRSVQTKSAMT